MKQLTTQFENQLLDFISKESKLGQSQWFYSYKRNFKIYVRNCPKFINGTFYDSSVIANIEVKGSLREKGFFSKTVQFIYNNTNKPLVMIENAINPVVQNWCIKNEWELYYDPADDHEHLRLLPSYFKIKTI